MSPLLISSRNVRVARIPRPYERTVAITSGITFQKLLSSIGGYYPVPRVPPTLNQRSNLVCSRSCMTDSHHSLVAAVGVVDRGPLVLSSFCPRPKWRRHSHGRAGMGSSNGIYITVYIQRVNLISSLRCTWFLPSRHGSHTVTRIPESL
jgi:hypothetical protein